jgi:hypothetical protein
VGALSNFLNVNKGRKLTVKMMQEEINQNESLPSLSDFSIRKILKRELKMRYKKADILYSNYFRPESSRKFAESASSLLRLRSRGF